MSRFNMLRLTRYMPYIMVLIMMLCGIWAESDAQVRKIGGAQVDGSVPPNTVVPCTTMGFSVESTLALGSSFDRGVFLRVDKSAKKNEGGLGYAVVDGGATYVKLVVFNMDTLAQVGTLTIQTGAGKYRLAGRYQGDVGSDGRLYLAQEVNNNIAFGCSGGGGFNCVSVSKYFATILEGEGINGTGVTSNIDDVRFMDDTTMLTVLANGAGNRDFYNIDVGTLALSTIGTATGVSAFGHITNALNGFNYVALARASAPNLYRVPVGSATSTGTASFTASFTTKIMAAVYGILNNGSGQQLIVADSDQTGAIQAIRGYVTEALVNCCSNSYNVAGDNGGAVFQSTFWDSINQKVYSLRTAATGQWLRTTPGVGSFAVEESFNCAPLTLCANAVSGTIVGTQVADFSENLARLYMINDQSPATISKIKVCATGGP